MLKRWPLTQRKREKNHRFEDVSWYVSSKVSVEISTFFYTLYLDFDKLPETGKWEISIWTQIFLIKLFQHQMILTMLFVYIIYIPGLGYGSLQCWVSYSSYILNSLIGFPITLFLHCFVNLISTSTSWTIQCHGTKN